MARRRRRARRKEEISSLLLKRSKQKPTQLAHSGLQAKHLESMAQAHGAGAGARNQATLLQMQKQMGNRSTVQFLTGHNRGDLQDRTIRSNGIIQRQVGSPSFDTAGLEKQLSQDVSGKMRSVAKETAGQTTLEEKLKKDAIKAGKSAALDTAGKYDPGPDIAQAKKYFNSWKFGLAIAEYRRIIAMPNVDSDTKAKMYLEIAKCYRHWNKWPDYIRTLEELVIHDRSKKSKAIEVFEDTFKHEVGRKFYALAIKLIKLFMASSIPKGYSSGLKNIALLSARTGKIDDYLKHMDAYLKSGENTLENLVDGMVEVAKKQYKAGKYQDCIKILDYLRKHPDLPHAKKTMVHRVLIKLSLKTGNIPQAKRFLALMIGELGYIDEAKYLRGVIMKREGKATGSG